MAKTGRLPTRELARGPLEGICVERPSRGITGLTLYEPGDGRARENCPNQNLRAFGPVRHSSMRSEGPAQNRKLIGAVLMGMNGIGRSLFLLNTAQVLTSRPPRIPGHTRARTLHGVPDGLNSQRYPNGRRGASSAAPRSSRTGPGIVVMERLIGAVWPKMNGSWHLRGQPDEDRFRTPLPPATGNFATPLTLRRGLDDGASESCPNGGIRTAAHAHHPVFMRIRNAIAEESMGQFAKR